LRHFSRSLARFPSPCYAAQVAGKPTIAIVGPGRFGSALAREVAKSGYRVRELVSRSPRAESAVKMARTLRARSTQIQNAALDSDLIWLCVPDRRIARVAAELSRRGDWKSKTVFHSSGALDSGVLQALKRRGAKVASVHPMMTFVKASTPTMKGISFALEGDAGALRLARRIVGDLDAHAFLIRREDKPLYHAWGSFTSPLVIALWATAQRVAKAAGIKGHEISRIMAPILCQTLMNYMALGAEGAFSGPLVRGDTEVVAKHLHALKRVPEARAVYVALAQAAVKHLPVGERQRVLKLLKS